MELFVRFWMILSFTGIVYGTGKDLPQTFTKCKRSDPNLAKCLGKSITDAIQQMKSGLPEFGILSLDPLAVDLITMSHGSDSPIKLRQTYTNAKMYNLYDTNTQNVVFDFDNFRLKVKAISPRLVIIADYEMDGKVLVFPINGNGLANITIVDMVADHELIGVSYLKNGEVYWRIVEYKIKLEPKLVHVHYDNLFNGNTTLTDTTNNILNDNWQIVFNEMKDGFVEAFESIFKDITNKIFSNVPISQIFLD